MTVVYKTKYFYDEEGFLVAPSDLKGSEKSTEIEPIKLVNGIEVALSKPKFDGEKWIETENKILPQNPLQVSLGQLTLQVATLQESNKKLSESLGQMALMMAKQDEEGGK
ncbi:hypothetical protein M5361_14900 [Ligilactobacillus agilis]|nr:hypothetical protein [Ligilactobacillus agilis]MCL8206417.1 hypothetical protein [Ligilactobacillus agilis]